MSPDIQQRLSDARRLILHGSGSDFPAHPYLVAALSNARFVELPPHPVRVALVAQHKLPPSFLKPDIICIDPDYRIYFDPDFIRKLNLKALAELIIHELWHPLRRHFDRSRDMLGVDPADFPPTMREVLLSTLNICQDAEINQHFDYIPNSYVLKNGILPEHIGANYGESFEQMFRRLWPDIKKTLEELLQQQKKQQQQTGPGQQQGNRSQNAQTQQPHAQQQQPGARPQAHSQQQTASQQQQGLQQTSPQQQQGLQQAAGQQPGSQQQNGQQTPGQQPYTGQPNQSPGQQPRAPQQGFQQGQSSGQQQGLQQGGQQSHAGQSNQQQDFQQGGQHCTPSSQTPGAPSTSQPEASEQSASDQTAPQQSGSAAKAAGQEQSERLADMLGQLDPQTLHDLIQKLRQEMGYPGDQEEFRPDLSRWPGIEKLQQEQQAEAPLPDLLKRSIERKTAEDLIVFIRQQEKNRGAGFSPGLRRWAEETLAPTRIPYQRIFASLVSRYLSLAQTANRRLSFARPSRRQVPGLLLPGTQGMRYRVGFVFDTSGSVSDRELGLYVQELRNCLRSYSHMCEVMYFSADVRVHNQMRVHLGDLHPERLDIRGGGGTELDKVIEEIAAMRRPPQVLFVLTDGITPWPKEKPRTIERVVIGLTEEPSSTFPPPAWADHIAYLYDRELERSRA